MEENSSWSGWIIFLIIVVAAALVYCLYWMGRKDGRPEAEDRQPLRRALPDKELAARAGQAWSAYLDLYALGQDCKLARKTLCDEGILYYFQQLCGFFTAGWDEAVLASRIRGVIVDGLRNVLALRLGHDAEREYAFPVRKAAPRMDFNGYLARLGIDLNAADSAETAARLGSEHDRIRRERDALTTDPNGIYYRRVLDDVLPPLNAFVGDKSLPRLPDGIDLIEVVVPLLRGENAAEGRAAQLHHGSRPVRARQAELVRAEDAHLAERVAHTARGLREAVALAGTILAGIAGLRAVRRR